MAAPLGLVTKAIRCGKRGNGRSRGIKEALGRQPLAQFAQGQLQGADALRLDLPDDELIAATRCIDVEVSLADHLQAVFQFETQAGRRRAPQNRPQLRRSSLSVR